MKKLSSSGKSLHNWNAKPKLQIFYDVREISEGGPYWSVESDLEWAS